MHNIQVLQFVAIRPVTTALGPSAARPRAVEWWRLPIGRHPAGFQFRPWEIHWKYPLTSP